MLVDVKSPGLLIVGRKMLHIGANALILYALYDLRREACRQERILAEALEHSAVAGIALNVYVRAAQHNVDAVGRGLLAHRRTDPINKPAVPRGAQCHANREATRKLAVGEHILIRVFDNFSGFRREIRCPVSLFRHLGDRVHPLGDLEHPLRARADPRLHVGIFGELVLGVSLHVILIQIDAGDSIKADDRRDAVFFKGIGHRL